MRRRAQHGVAEASILRANGEVAATYEVGARWSLVSGMSWGYSGNLGFPLPDNWSFNQIREYEFQSGWGLDHDIWRDGADSGVSALVTG